MSAFNIDPQEMDDEKAHIMAAIKRRAGAEQGNPLTTGLRVGAIGAGMGGIAGAGLGFAAGLPHRGLAGAVAGGLTGAATLGLLAGTAGAGGMVAHNQGIDREKALLASDPDVLERTLRHRARQAIRNRVAAYEERVSAAGAPNITTNVYSDYDPYLD